MVVHQRQRFPARHQAVGCDCRSGAGCQRADLARYIGIERLVEGQRKDGQLAVELILRAKQGVALQHAVGAQRSQTQAVNRVLGRRARRHAHPLNGAFQVGGQSRGQGLVHGRAVRRRPGLDPPRARLLPLHHWHIGTPAPDLNATPHPPATSRCRRTGAGQRRFSASRISRSSTTSSGVGAGAAGAGAGSARFILLTWRIIMKMTRAKMMKLIATVMKLP